MIIVIVLTVGMVGKLYHFTNVYGGALNIF